jgi:putative ABC transport system permease protein
MENLWLGSFAYHVNVGIGPLIIASAICIAIAFFTASYQAVKAALLNPSNALRSE